MQWNLWKHDWSMSHVDRSILVSTFLFFVKPHKNSHFITKPSEHKFHITVDAVTFLTCSKEIQKHNARNSTFMYSRCISNFTGFCTYAITSAVEHFYDFNAIEACCHFVLSMPIAFIICIANTTHVKAQMKYTRTDEFKSDSMKFSYSTSMGFPFNVKFMREKNLIALPIFG